VGDDRLAQVTIAEAADGKRIEFVESLQPPRGREQKWVNIISTMFGCPVKCQICDAGMRYMGQLSAEEMFFQLDYMITRHWKAFTVHSDLWKIQFSRVGDPAFNPAVIDVLRGLPRRYRAKNLLPSISTVAPRLNTSFYDDLVAVKDEIYPDSFQFQFSIHSTDMRVRRNLIPVDCWDFTEMAHYGERMFVSGGRRITLNFALAKNIEVNAAALRKYFPSDVFIVKITPVNPTFKARASGIIPTSPLGSEWNNRVDQFRNCGYDVIESVGEMRENAIGSNCGQFIQALEQGAEPAIVDAYLYPVESVTLRAAGCLEEVVPLLAKQR